MTAPHAWGCFSYDRNEFRVLPSFLASLHSLMTVAQNSQTSIEVSPIPMDALRMLASIQQCQYIAGIQNGSSELRALSKTVGQQSVTIEKLTTRLQTVEEEVAILHAWMETQQDDCLGSSRGRRVMKLYIHPLFADLCGIERSLEHGVRALALTHVKPLDTYDALNAKFIQEVSQQIWDDEMTQCQQTGKGELPDSDYSMPIIKECMKTYF
ncbi:hypothetical protein F5J12DRAFT_781669 [Pisolithus orientalis]|uniref:uncharacterized protein n=1 Tax=Pisolithus orientalis TaxID=936130 RepID=UPI0022249BE0|nr:uncharacterized protein F5J12DRAFT_781669 [Pisolithus orientalis]KAI6012817.1 hypothetical protein F5J12DRAFT_781669 [Pisolithus orientalis]